MTNARRNNLLATAALVLLGLAAAVSLATGVRHAFAYNSHDLQWTSGRLLREHIDPWGERLANYPHHLRHFSPPNYLHLLYLLLLPVSGVSFHTAEVVWCAVSILSSIAAVYVLARLFELNRVQGLAVLFLLWMSSPFRVTLETGQFSLVELFFLSATFAATSAVIAGLAFGVSLVKYSFSPVAFLLLLLRRRWTLLLVAIGLCVLAVLGCRLLLPTPLLQLAREPFEVSRIAVSPGLADAMTLVEYGLRTSLGAGRAQTVSYALALVSSVVFAFWVSRYRLSRAVELTLVSLASLLLFKHLLYDYVFLVVPLCFALKLPSLRAKLPIFAGVFLFWFVAFVLNRAASDLVVHLPALAVNVVLLALLTGYTTVIALRHAPGSR